MQSTFRIFKRSDFRNYILSSNFSRPIKIIQNHHTWLPDFPNQSTGDQFFDESQFESYRKLGYHSIEKISQL
jgi:hypothetical protein